MSTETVLLIRVAELEGVLREARGFLPFGLPETTAGDWVHKALELGRRIDTILAPLDGSEGKPGNG